MNRFKAVLFAAALTTASVLPAVTAVHAAPPVSILNVSYDPTRELYQSYNVAFGAYWKTRSGGQIVTVKQNHGGSGKQARAVIDGLEADVVTLALAYDVDAISKAGLIKPGWESRLPFNSAPYTSTIVFVVRKGNPKHIHGWADLARPGVSNVIANPKTSGGARWGYLAAWGYALKQPGGNPTTAFNFVKKVYKNVAKMDTGSRGATITFTQQHVGDVYIALENEAEYITKKVAPGQYEIVTPSISILAEPSVAVVDSNVDEHNTRTVSEAYVGYLYSPQGQTIAAQNYYRPRNPKVAKQYAAQFPKLKLFTVADTFGGWDAAQKTHFADGGTFDRIFR